MPEGWTALLMFWSRRPVENVWGVPREDWLRDAVLCPDHTAALQRQLKALPTQLDQEPAGNA
jgi:hypothetical protein